MADDASSEDFEEGLDVAGCAGSVDDGEGAVLQGGVELADLVAVGLGAGDGDGGRAVREAGEDVEEAVAAFLGFVGRGALEGEAQVDDGDVDGEVLDELGGLAAGAGVVGLDAHGGEERGEPAGPGVEAVAGVGEEEVESARCWLGDGLGCGLGLAGAGGRGVGAVSPAAAVCRIARSHLHGVRRGKRRA